MKKEKDAILNFSSWTIMSDSKLSSNLVTQLVGSLAWVFVS